MQHGPDGQGAAAATKAARVEVAKQFEEILSLGLANGELPASTDVRTLAQFYVSFLQGMAAQAIDGVGHDELNAVVDIALTAWPAAHQLAAGGRSASA